MVGQFHSNGAVHQSASTELDREIKVFLVFAEGKTDSLGKSLFILEDAHKEDVDEVLPKIGF